MDIRATVALPLYNDADIAWLPMEGLCAQETSHTWELVVIEERVGAVGQEWVDKWYPRLADAGCMRVQYVGLSDWQPLSVKWKIAANVATPTSRYFLLQGSDDYPYPNRVQDTIDLMDLGADFVCQGITKFYDLHGDRWCAFHADRQPNSCIGPNIGCLRHDVAMMATKLDRRENDTHVYHSVKPLKARLIMGGQTDRGFCTAQTDRLSDRRHWFTESPLTPLQVRPKATPPHVPDSIMERLRALNESR